MITKILINNSGATKQILNRDIAHEEGYNIPTEQWLELINNSSIMADIESGNIIVNDGTNNLSIEEGITLINQLQESEGGFGKRLISNNLFISQEDEMIVSDGVEITTDGCLDINGLFTILGE